MRAPPSLGNAAGGNAAGAYLRGVPTDLPALGRRDADHRLHHRASGRSGHPGAHRRTREPAKVLALDGQEQAPAVKRFWSSRTGVPRPTDVVGYPVDGRIRIDRSVV